MPQRADVDTIDLARELAARLFGSPLWRHAARIINGLEPRRHGPDFASVAWDGANYIFTSSQAAVVRILWTAWEDGLPEIRQETILEKIGSDSGRLLDLFRDHPAWGQLIISGTIRGTFKLNNPA